MTAWYTMRGVWYAHLTVCFLTELTSRPCRNRGQIRISTPLCHHFLTSRWLRLHCRLQSFSGTSTFLNPAAGKEVIICLDLSCRPKNSLASSFFLWAGAAHIIYVVLYILDILAFFKHLCCSGETDVAERSPLRHILKTNNISGCSQQVVKCGAFILAFCNHFFTHLSY